MENNNNEFFGADEKYIPESENVNVEYTESENVNVEYTKKDKKKFNVFLIILLVSLPFIIFIISAIIMSIMRFSMMDKMMGVGNDAIKETLKATSDLHQTTSQMEIASDIYESSSDVLDEVTEETEVQAKEMFNSKFTAYAGEQRGTLVKALITAVTSNNSTGQRQIEVKGITTVTDVISQETYNIKINYDSLGYVNEIVISEAK